MNEVGDYTATVERNMLGEREWFIRVRYVTATTMGGRKQYETFNLIPQHQGQMFSQVCDSIVPAVEAHANKRRLNHVAS